MPRIIPNPAALFSLFALPCPASAGRVFKKQTKEKSMKQQPQIQASGALETTRFFAPRFPSAAGVAGELCTTKRKDPDMGKRNTNSWEGQRPRCPQPQPETTQNTQNQAILKNSTIPQSNFYSSWGLSPEFQKTARRGRIGECHGLRRAYRRIRT